MTKPKSLEFALGRFKETGEPASAKVALTIADALLVQNPDDPEVRAVLRDVIVEMIKRGDDGTGIFGAAYQSLLRDNQHMLMREYPHISVPHMEQSTALGFAVGKFTATGAPEQARTALMLADEALQGNPQDGTAKSALLEIAVGMVSKGAGGTHGLAYQGLLRDRINHKTSPAFSMAGVLLQEQMMQQRIAQNKPAAAARNPKL